MNRPPTNVIGFDDGPFARSCRGDVLLVGAVCARTRLDGVLTGRVRRDGTNSAARMEALVRGSQFRDAVRAVLLNGIAVAGFNVVDIHALSERLEVPVIVVCRRPPDFGEIRRALGRVPGGTRKWRLIRQAGPLVACGPVWIQIAGIEAGPAREVMRRTTLHGHLPEPLRLAHLIAGGVATGKSRGRA
jgi:uncharacterized protein